MSDKLFHRCASAAEAREAVERIDAARAEKLGPIEATETNHGGARSRGVRALVAQGLVDVDRRTGAITITKAGEGVGLLERDGVVVQLGTMPRRTWCVPIPLATGELAVLHDEETAGEEVTVRGQRRRLPDASAARPIAPEERLRVDDESAEPVDPRGGGVRGGRTNDG